MMLLLLIFFGFVAPALGQVLEPGPLPLPDIGPWLLDPDGNPAHWLGARIGGRTLVEPVNVVVVDAFAGSAEEALNKLLGEVATDGYGEKWGHSSGYWASIGGELFPQIA